LGKGSLSGKEKKGLTKGQNFLKTWYLTVTSPLGKNGQVGRGSGPTKEETTQTTKVIRTEKLKMGSAPSGERVSLLKSSTPGEAK